MIYYWRGKKEKGKGKGNEGKGNGGKGKRGKKGMEQREENWDQSLVNC